MTPTRGRMRLLVLVVCLLVPVVMGVAAAVDSGDSLGRDERAAVDAVRNREENSAAGAARVIDDHVEALVSADVVASVGGAVLADVFERGLSVDEGREARLGAVAAAVSEEGAIHSRELRGVLAVAVADDVSWLDARVNRPLLSGEAEVPGVAVREYLVAHDLVREVVRDVDAATLLREAIDTYGAAEVAAAPDDGDERSTRLSGLGALQAFVTWAQLNAAMGEVRTEGIEAVEAAEAADTARVREDRAVAALWLARDMWEDDPSVRRAAEGASFLGADGLIADDLSADQAAELQEWAISLTGETGPLRRQYAWVGIGWGDLAGTPALNLEGRVG